MLITHIVSFALSWYFPGWVGGWLGGLVVGNWRVMLNSTQKSKLKFELSLAILIPTSIEVLEFITLLILD